jgi:hypothetical protein
LNIFFRLYELATRIQADDALGVVYNGYVAAQDKDMVKALQKQRGEPFTIPHKEQSPDEIKKAMDLAREVVKNPDMLTITDSLKINDLKKEFSNV